MALRLPLCLFNRHVPNRHRVKWDGLNFVGTCRYCKRPIRKEEHKGWLKDQMQSAATHSPPAESGRADTGAE